MSESVMEAQQKLSELQRLQADEARTVAATSAQTLQLQLNELEKQRQEQMQLFLTHNRIAKEAKSNLDTLAGRIAWLQSQAHDLAGGF